MDRRVLVVEDDRAIADAVARRLRSAGYVIDVVHDGRAAVEAGQRTAYDAVVLDLMLPGLDGLEVCRRLQQRLPVPVLMLTARDEEADRVIGLSVGADDYLTKPFSPRELVARVAALLRRVDRAREIAAEMPAPGHRLAVGDLRVDLPSRRTYVADAEVHLTRTEFDIVTVLARTPGQVVEREQLLTQVWAWEPAAAARAVATGASRTLDSHIKARRRKLGTERIRTVHGIGYAVEVLP